MEDLLALSEDEAAGPRLRGRQGGCFRVSLNRPKFWRLGGLDSYDLEQNARLRSLEVGFMGPRWCRAREVELLMGGGG